MGSNPLYYPPGARHPVAAARRRRATRQEAWDRRRAPTDANFAQGAEPPSRPSCSAGHRADERRNGISPGVSLPAAAWSPRSEEPCAGLGERSATRCRREASSRVPDRSQPANRRWPAFGCPWADLPNGREWCRLRKLGRADWPMKCRVRPVDRPFEIIFIGRLERWKGPEWLIEAVARHANRWIAGSRSSAIFEGERQRLTERVVSTRDRVSRRVLRMAVPRALRRTAA